MTELRSSALPAEVVLQAEGVPHLVRRQLPQARQSHLQQARVRFRAVFVGLQQALRNEEILPHAQRPQGDPALNYFTRCVGPRPRAP